MIIIKKKFDFKCLRFRKAKFWYLEREVSNNEILCSFDGVGSHTEKKLIFVDWV